VREAKGGQKKETLRDEAKEQIIERGDNPACARAVAANTVPYHIKSIRPDSELQDSH